MKKYLAFVAMFFATITLSAQNYQTNRFGDYENSFYNGSQSVNRAQEAQEVERPTFDEYDILARLKTGVTLNSSSNYEVGGLYPLFEVVASIDENLRGCTVVCKIMEKRRSNISGSEGRLILRPMYIKKNDDTIVRLLPTDIYKRGLNRTNVKTWLTFPLFPLYFVAGSGAEVKSSELYEMRIEK